MDERGSSLSTTCSLDLQGFFIPFHLHKDFFNAGMPNCLASSQSGSGMNKNANNETE